MFQFYLYLCDTSLLELSVASGVERLARPVSCGRQTFKTDPDTYPVSKDMPKIASLLLVRLKGVSPKHFWIFVWTLKVLSFFRPTYPWGVAGQQLKLERSSLLILRNKGSKCQSQRWNTKARSTKISSLAIEFCCGPRLSNFSDCLLR